MKKHHYAIADKNRFMFFCVSVLLGCMVGGYLIGSAVTARHVSAQTNVVYYAPQHFATQRSK